MNVVKRGLPRGGEKLTRRHGGAGWNKYSVVSIQEGNSFKDKDHGAK